MNMDFIGFNSIRGQFASKIKSSSVLDVGLMRPFMANDGHIYKSIFTGGDPKDIKNYKNVLVLNRNDELLANATLRRDEWKQLDTAILEASRLRLTGVQDLINSNLVLSLGNAMGTTVLEWHSVSEAFTASLTMDGITRGEADRLNFETNYLPLPVIHIDYDINTRVLEASRSLGNPLDTSQAAEAAKTISEQLETMLFTNTTYAYGGGTIYSYVNHPNRNTGSLTANWDDSAIEAYSNIIDDVRAMKQDSINARHYGPWHLYIPTNYETVMDADYNSTTPGTTVRERILKIDGINAVKISDFLAADNVLLVEMRTETVRMVRGIGITNVEWKTEGNFNTKYKVFTIQVPQIRADQAGRCGVVHYS